MPPRNVTELVPLPEHPPQVKTPEVEKVTGSALARDTPRNATTTSRAHRRAIPGTPVAVARRSFGSTGRQPSTGGIRDLPVHRGDAVVGGRGNQGQRSGTGGGGVFDSTD